MTVLEPCSKSEFGDFVRDLNLKVEMDIAHDCVGMRYVNRNVVVCASSRIDLLSGAESDWKIDREQEVERVDPPADDYQPERKSRVRGPRPTDDELFKSFSDGQSVKEIAEKYGIPKVYVYRRVWAHPDYLNRQYKRIQEMVDLHTSGVSHAKIADLYGVSPQSVSARLLRWGFDKKNNGIRFKRKSEIIEKYLSGSGVRELAKEYAVSKQAIYKLLNNAGYRGGDRNRK